MRPHLLHFTAVRSATLRAALDRMAVLACLVAAVACTRVGAGRSDGRHPWTRPGVLRIADLSEPDTLNADIGSQQIDGDLAELWGAFLTEFDEHGNLVPELLTRVPTLANGDISPDGRRIVLRLRTGVKWHDGAPFTADDVVFSQSAIMNPRNDVGTRTGYDRVERIEAPDAHTVVVHLIAPYAPFVSTYFSMASASISTLLPKHLLGALPDIDRIPYNAKPIGTGPFVVREWHRGSAIVFDANPNYWRGAPKLAQIEFRAIPNENTILTELRTHEVDLYYNAPVALGPQLDGLDGVRVERTPFAEFAQIEFNAAVPVLSDVRVRQALAYGLDRKTIANDVTHGIGDVPGPITDQPESSWARAKGLPAYGYDPAKARALLDAAGWIPGPDGIRVKDGRRLTILMAAVSGSTTATATLVLVQRAWHDLGVDGEVKTFISSRFFASYGENGIIERGLFDVAFDRWVQGFDPDDETLFACSKVPPAGANSYHFCSKAADAAQHVALESNDRAVRARAYAAIQRELDTGVPYVPMWFDRRIDAMNDDLRNYRPAHAVTTWTAPWEWQI